MGELGRDPQGWGLPLAIARHPPLGDDGVHERHPVVGLRVLVEDRLHVAGELNLLVIFKHVPVEADQMARLVVEAKVGQLDLGTAVLVALVESIGLDLVVGERDELFDRALGMRLVELHGRVLLEALATEPAKDGRVGRFAAALFRQRSPLPALLLLGHGLLALAALASELKVAVGAFGFPVRHVVSSSLWVSEKSTKSQKRRNS